MGYIRSLDYSSNGRISSSIIIEVTHKIYLNRGKEISGKKGSWEWKDEHVKNKFTTNTLKTAFLKMIIFPFIAIYYLKAKCLETNRWVLLLKTVKIFKLLTDYFS